jgi:hypothetical protein
LNGKFLTANSVQVYSSDIHQIAAGSFANLPCFRLLRKPAPLARAVDGDGTSWRHCRASNIAEFSVIEVHLSREFGSDA